MAGRSAVFMLLADGSDPVATRRMYQQRVVTAAIIVVLVVLILIILWAKLFR